jgi:exonuclease III
VQSELTSAQAITENSTIDRIGKNYDNLKIAFHNINGIKNNQHKFLELIEYSKEHSFNIIGITETNTKEREAKYFGNLGTDYNSWWTSAEEGKHKGSGVGIIVDTKWSDHLTEVRRPNAYSIRVAFSFKKAKIVVWIVYIPPNDSKMQKEIQREIIEDIAKKKEEVQYIIGGDFNRILDPELDSTNTHMKGKKPQLPLIKWMANLGFAERLEPVIQRPESLLGQISKYRQESIKSGYQEKLEKVCRRVT